MVPKGDSEDLDLFLWVLKIHNASAHGRDQWLGNPERRRESVIEPLCKIASQFKMLFLVFSDRNAVRLIEQDIGGLQHWIGKQPCSRPSLIPPRFLFFELHHTAQFPHAG
jgi:hypothetical protein